MRDVKHSKGKGWRERHGEKPQDGARKEGVGKRD